MVSFKYACLKRIRSEFATGLTVSVFRTRLEKLNATPAVRPEVHLAVHLVRCTLMLCQTVWSFAHSDVANMNVRV